MENRLVICGLIQAHMASSRLPGKVLHEIHNRPLLDIQIERLSKCRLLNKVAVITSGSPLDDPLVSYCRSHNVAYYRGSDRDVLDRYYQAAVEFGADVVVRLCSDCPLIDPAVVDHVVSSFLEYPGGLDFLSNTEPQHGRTYPDGMDVSVFSMATLERSWLEADKPSEREHVIFYIYQHPEKFKVHLLDAPADLSSYRFTVDYPEDMTLIERLYEELVRRGQFGTMNELIQIVDNNPELKELNSKYTFGAGWAPSLKKDEEMKSTKAELAPPLNRTNSEKLWSEVLRHIPGGAQTFSKMPAQYVNGVAPKMLYRGQGCRVWDLDGNEFIDSVMGLGPIILGHCIPEVNRAVADCADNLFNSPSLPHPLELKLAERLQELIPCAEMVRFAKNGSDVTSAAVRLARSITGRDVIACCGYHGWHDWYIGSTNRNAGVPMAVRKLTAQFVYNDLESLENVFKTYKGNVALVILEPVTFEPPQDGFLHKIRELCDKHGTLLAFDETMTGFRFHLGGAQTYFGVTPDLAIFGKAIANGYPISAICGKAEYIRGFKDAFFSFTHGGELPSIVAALTVLDILEREKVPDKIHAMGQKLIDGYNALVKELDIPYSRAFGYGCWPKYEFQEQNGFSAQEILTLFQQEIVKRGILTRNTPFISLAHKEPDIREMLAAMRKALLVVRKAVADKKVTEWLQGDVIQPVIRDDIVKH